MHIASIADDLTGATDIAGFLANGGLRTLLFIGVPQDNAAVTATASGANHSDAAVVSLKTRSCPAPQAVEKSLAALDFLRMIGRGQIYFKYCSTFDSTSRGNIGPVTDALLDRLGVDFTVICPSLPVNGRTVRDGILYVNGVPLAESPMRSHPVNPMRDSSLIRLMEWQSRGRAGVVPIAVVRQGVGEIKNALARLRAEGVRYAVLDAETEGDLAALAAALGEAPLLTGGSGLAGERARQVAAEMGQASGPASRPEVNRGKTVILSGSCSEATNRQVGAYLGLAASRKVDVERAFSDPEEYALQLAEWAEEVAGAFRAPLVYATATPEELSEVQKRFGSEASSRAVESLFGLLARRLVSCGFNRFIVAGGETSGAVTEAIPFAAFRLGPEIAPGVPWIQAAAGDCCLALKSGNFGQDGFFAAAQDLLQ